MSITLTPGRLALRRPELGGFLMVEVEACPVGIDDSLYRMELDREHGEQYHEIDPDNFLPVLRPGDVVPAGSLLWDIARQQTFECEWEGRMPGEARYALLRYGLEEDA